MPNVSENFKSAGSNFKTPIHWIIAAILLMFCGYFGIREIQRNENLISSIIHQILNILKRNKAIRISGIDFVSDVMKEKMQALGSKMEDICKERSDDVIFAFNSVKDKVEERSCVCIVFSKDKSVWKR